MTCRFLAYELCGDSSWVVYRSCGPIRGVDDYDRRRAMHPSYPCCSAVERPVDELPPPRRPGAGRPSGRTDERGVE